VSEETCFAGLTSQRRPGGCRVGGHTLFEGSTVFFRGGDVEEVREWAAQCHEMTLAFTHSSRTASGMAALRGLVEQPRDVILRRCQRADVAGIRLTRAPATYRSI
jgi:predicted transcriptional regulator